MTERLPHLNTRNTKVREAMMQFKRTLGLQLWDELTQGQIRQFEVQFCREVILASTRHGAGKPHLYTAINEPACRALHKEYCQAFKISAAYPLCDWQRNELDHYIAKRILEEAADGQAEGSEQSAKAV